MDINSIWDKRLKAFYSEIVRYYSVITMSVLYSIIIFGSIFLYYYLKFLKWMPSSFPAELVAALSVSLLFLATGIRTFLKKADLIFLMPAEARLSLYFKKAMLYSACITAIQIVILFIIISPMIRQTEISTITYLITFLGLIFLNIRLTWIEQWLATPFHRIAHSAFRFLLFGTILYFLFHGFWKIAGGLLLFAVILWFFGVNKKTTAVNWDFLIQKEEKAAEKFYIFINFYFDVPHLKYSFKHRQPLGWAIKKAILHKQSSTYTYLFSHLFVRFNEFYYLYVRLTVIGCAIIYVLPAYGWLVSFPVVFFTGYQLLPLQHSLTDTSRTYPISVATMRNSFKKMLVILSLIQLVLLNSALLIHVSPLKVVGMISIEILYMYWFVYIFAANRIFNKNSEAFH
ncbi:ABC transporter permease [Sporosarcina sp. NPDC096371]|uniref:ABC transporter permease n=1 Tax=Sporosarcina sp. NPDC096371 TaxID=3364530 RepID=UPI00381E81F8